jgi:peptidoglycan LD-endopeptidase LytH
MRLSNMFTRETASSFLALSILATLFMMPLFVAAQSFDEDDYERWARRSGLSRDAREAISDMDEDPEEHLPIPVLLGVELRNLTKNFGDPRDGGTRTHEGLDMLAPEGTPVASPTEAVVTRVGDGAGSGIYVRTANPGGETFVYMHLVSIAKGLRRGDVLKRGDLIGFVGNTGNASGGPPHLHFEIRKDGALDPYPRLTEVFTLEERVRGIGEAIQNGGEDYLPLYASRLAALSASLGVAPTASVGATNPAFSRDLELGSTGPDVRALQQFLNAAGFVIATEGPGSPGAESEYFGAKTQEALARYQRAVGITPASGYFGPKTRATVKL